MPITLTSAGYVDLTSAGRIDAGSSAPQKFTAGWGVYAVSYDGTTLNYYFNDTLLYTRTPSSPVLFADTGATFIGQDRVNGAFTGQLAAVKIYDTALSSAEVIAASNALNTTYLAVPEPAAWALMAAGAGASVLFRRFRRRDSRR